MPIIVRAKDISWKETKQKLSIIVPLKSWVDSKISILTTSRYLKVSSPPWIWECFLASSVDPDESRATVESEAVSFELKKKGPALWHQLEDSRKEDASFCKEQREAAFEEHQKWLLDNAESKAKRKHEIHQASVRKQMELTSRERSAIERAKQAENERVTAEIQRMKRKNLEAEKIARMRHELLLQSKSLPPPRCPGRIAVSFTPRVFPTAARESQEAEEREWLEKQSSAARSLEVDCKDLSPHEKNPEWLKAKGESLSKKGDFRGAVNAYSLGIRMCPNLYSLYLGRSACHLNLRNLHKCIEDSSKALELLQPAVASNADDRLRAHKIRGASFRALKLPVEGLMDLEAALKIDPHDEELRKDTEALRESVEISSD